MSEEKGPYVIDEDDLGCLHDYLVAAINGDDISELPRLWNQELGVIRSRPLSEEIRKAREDVLDKCDKFSDEQMQRAKGISDGVGSMIRQYTIKAYKELFKSLREGAP